MAEGVICQCCGVEAPCKYVVFRQNIGALVMRFHKRMEGNLCKKCIGSHFWPFTLTTLAIGWFGTISLVVTPVFIVMNIFHYLGSLTLARVPHGAAPPVLTAYAVQQLQPHAGQIVNRLNAKEPLLEVARAVASQANVTPGQVVLYAVALSRGARLATPPPLPVRAM